MSIPAFIGDYACTILEKDRRVFVTTLPLKLSDKANSDRPLYILADTVLVDKLCQFPSIDLTILCRQLVFTDGGVIDTSGMAPLINFPTDSKAQPGLVRGEAGHTGANGSHGMRAGNVCIYAGAVEGQLNVLANGGHGGRGENGGDGILGIQGPQGSGVLAPNGPQEGSVGGTGGQGGRAGSAGHSGDGGLAGTITIRTLNHLPVAALLSAKGGQGGDAAVPGQRGEGGGGGAGTPSCHYVRGLGVLVNVVLASDDADRNSKQPAEITASMWAEAHVNAINMTGGMKPLLVRQRARLADAGLFAFGVGSDFVAKPPAAACHSNDKFIIYH